MSPLIENELRGDEKWEHHAITLAIQIQGKTASTSSSYIIYFSPLKQLLLKLI